jgi:hypothetical protein
MANPIIEGIKKSLPTHRWRSLRRATNRLRWLLKLRLLRIYQFPVLSRPVRALQYVLWDPEVESFSYDLDNLDELSRFMASLLQVDREKVAAWIDEAQTDPILTRDRGFRWSSKRHQPLGNRLMWYILVRSMRPKLVVEAGVHDGLGSEVLLCALRRNQQDGFPGRLISFDIHEDTGWLVAPELRQDWQIVVDSTTTGMEPVLKGLEVDLFIHETPHTEQIIGSELSTVLRHAGPRLMFVDSGGHVAPTLRNECERQGITHHYFLDQPKNHVVKSHGTGFAMFERYPASLPSQDLICVPETYDASPRQPVAANDEAVAVGASSALA